MASLSLLRKILPPQVKSILRPIYQGYLNICHKLFRTFFKLIQNILGKSLFFQMYHFLNGEIEKTVVVDGIVFDAAEHRPHERAVTLHSKEPDTIHWINDYVKEGEVFYDVGANIGVFSLYSALKRDARVLAFEPMATNYDILNKNIYLNDLSERITAYNIACNDMTELSEIALSAYIAGYAGHQFVSAGEIPDAQNSVFNQGVFGVSMDDLVYQFGLPAPRHVKIDVDGNEFRIVRGMSKLFLNGEIKSLAVELDLETRTSDVEAVNTIEAHGFRRLTNSKYLNKQYLSWTNVRNYYFVRDSG